MKTVKFALKQHTPIVHFQAKDNGATLRASEVKPKLDRYILVEKGRERLHDKGTLKEFLEEGARYFRELDLKEIEKKKKDKEYTPKLCCVPGQNEALNYKLFFQIEGAVKYFLPMNNVSEKRRRAIQNDAQKYLGLPSVELISPSPYFANEDKVKDEKWNEVRMATQVDGSIRGKILCQNEELSKIIESHLQSFFLLHNFGARQSKGFGSYMVDDNLDNILNLADSMYKSLSFEVEVESISEMFKRINYFYKSLRSGLNEYRNNGNIFYMKPAVYYYACKKGFQWDKKVIKDVLFNNLKCADIRYDFRDIFGFSAEEQWQDKTGSRFKLKKICTLNKNGTVNEVQRMKSPLQFKPILKSFRNDKKIRFEIYIGFFCDEVNLSDILKHKAEIVVLAKGKSIPFLFKEDLNVEKMLDEVFEGRDLEKELDEIVRPEGIEIKEILLDIYQQLKILYEK